MKIQDLLTDKSKWTQNTFTRDKWSHPLDDARAPRATKWCLMGAIHRCYSGPKIYEIQDTIRRYLELEVGGSIPTWNDDPKRTFDEVRDLVYKLDI